MSAQEVSCNIECAKKVILGAGVLHLTSLTNLKTLDVGYSLAGDASMAALSELTQLEYLDMDSCPITNTCDLHSCTSFLETALPAIFSLPCQLWNRIDKEPDLPPHDRLCPYIQHLQGWASPCMRF